MLHIHLLDKSYEPALAPESGIDFLDAAMAADFAFDLYAATHAADSALKGFVLKDESGAVVHEWRTGGAPPPKVAMPKASSLTVAVGVPANDDVPAAATLAAVPAATRKPRHTLARPWSPVVYRPLVAGLGLVAILGSARIDGFGAPPTVAQASAPAARLASAPPQRLASVAPPPRLDVEGRSVYVAPLSTGSPVEYAPVAARKARPVGLKRRGSRRARSSTHSRWATR